MLWTDYIRELDRKEDRFQRLYELYLAKYINNDELLDLLTELVDEYGDESEVIVDSVDDNLTISDPKEDCRYPRLCLDYEDVLRHKPPFMDNVWQYKEEIDNCTGFSVSDNLVGMTVLEEYGFVRLGSCMVSRTVQPFMVSPEGKYIPGCVLVLPKFDDKLFYEILKPSPAIGGGLSVQGVFRVYNIHNDSRFYKETGHRGVLHAFKLVTVVNDGDFTNQSKAINFNSDYVTSF